MPKFDLGSFENRATELTEVSDTSVNEVQKWLYLIFFILYI